MNQIQAASDESRELAIALLKQGALVALPTETVYGLAADARNPAAVQKIFVAKGRPNSHPLIVHYPPTTLAELHAREVLDLGGLPEPDIRGLEAAAARFWPGPLTLVLPRGRRASSDAAAGLPTVGVRVPAAPFFLDVLQAMPGGLAAPSANAFCRLSPTRAAHVAASLGPAVSLIVEADAGQVGIESTIVKWIAPGQLSVLRPGALSATDIATASGLKTTYAARDAPVESPGMLARHYAPRTPTWTASANTIQSATRQLLADGRQPLDIVWTDTYLPQTGVRHHRLGDTPTQAARTLYDILHQLDASDSGGILLQLPRPEARGWRGIRDRLERAGEAHSLLSQ